MALDPGLAERVRRLIRRRRGFEERRMFGGVGFLLNGHLCVGIWKDSLVVRFEKEAHDVVLTRDSVESFDITGRIMKGWALIRPDGIKTDGELLGWVDQSIVFVRSLPPKA